MNRKSNHQNLLRPALTLAVVMITMFALPTGAWAQQITYAYTIKVEYNVDKGTLLVNNVLSLIQHAQPGQTVTILAMPQTGYGLNSLTVTDEESNSIQLVQSAAAPNEYSFQLPEGVLSKAITLTVKGEFGTGGNSPIGGQGGTGISEATYAINGTASPAGGGTVTAYNGNDVITSAKENTVVTLTATPAEGYHFLKWIVTSGDDAVALGDEYSETTSFTIGYRGVSAQAVFVYGNSENCISYPAEGGWIVRDGTKVFVTVNEADGYYLKSVIRSTEAPTESTEQTTELSNGVSLGEPIAAVGKKPYYYASEGGYISAAFRKPSDDLRVTFNMNGHGTAIATQKLTFNAQGTATVTKPTDPEEEDCIFFGWYKDKNFTQPFNFSTVISKESLKYNKEIDCYPLTLYAKWRHISIVTFYANGGTGTMDPVTMDYESQYTIPECTFYNGGMTFAGWATSDEGNVVYQPGDIITLTGNLKLYAKWTEFTIDGLNYKITSLNPFTVELTGYEGDKPTGELNIPASVKIGGNDYSVTSISGNAFYNTSITSLIIPDAITTIGEHAFDDCDALTSVIIGNGVTSIGEHAFDDCGALTSVTFGNSVTSIGSWAFQICLSLTSVNIPATVTTIGSWAFMGCRNLTSVTINATSLTTYGKDAFKADPFGNASGLKIYVPAGSEDTYRAGWSEYAEVIEAIPEADATKYTITTDDYCEVYDTDIWSENTPLSEATAGMVLEISLKEGAQPASGKYFSGEYTVNGVSLGANEWEEFNSGFTMPAQAVTVAALQADRTVLTFDFSTAGPQEMTKAAIQLFNGDERLEGKRIRNEGDDGELIDFDGSGTPDMKRYFDATEDHCYVERLATADYTGSYSLTYEGPSDCYSAITFVFPSQSQQPLPTMDVSVTFTETTYDGKTHALNVSVPDGATITYADKQDGTYSATAPTFKDVVNTTIYYKVTKEGCQDATGTVAVKINKKPLKVTAEDKSWTSGGTEPALTYKTDGLVEGDKITVVLQRAEGNLVGTYDITLKSISGVDNYEVTFVKGVFTIKQPVINNNDPLGKLNGKELFALLDELKPIINQIAPGLNIALTADANGRLSVTVNGMTFSIGEELILVLRNVKKEDILTPAFQGKVMAYLSKLMNGNAGTRGSGDMVETELVSGEEFVIPDDGDLVLILKTEEAPVTITALTVTSKPDDSGDNKDDNKNDINGDGMVNAIDLVKAISDGKTKAEIDAIVNAIMGK